MTVQTWEPIPPGHPGVLTRNAYQAALAEARRDCRGQFLRSRGKWLTAYRGDQIVAGEAESWEWDGKRTSVTEAIAEARRLGWTELRISGGIDASGTIDFEDYDSWVAEWSVCVWESSPREAQGDK